MKNSNACRRNWANCCANICGSPDASFHLAPQTKLVPGANGLVSREIYFQHFFTLHLTPFFILQTENDFARLYVNHVPGGGICVITLDAERHPARLVSKLNAGNQLRRHHGGVEN